MNTSTNLSFDACDEYMLSRTGKYEYRAIRYRKTAQKLFEFGLNNLDTIYDLGAGWTEFDYCLRKEFDWKGRYVPIDAGISSVDLNSWTPERRTDFFVALEIVEHLYHPERILQIMSQYANKGVVISVPNPETVDVYAIDETHVSTPDKTLFTQEGYQVEDALFYGGVFSGGKNDALFAHKKITY